MASPGQQYVKRVYEYGYNNYTVLLQDVHDRLIKRIKKEENKKGAETLQTFLQDIKTTARYLNEQTEDFKKNSKAIPIMDKLILAQNDLSEWYTSLINEISTTQTGLRGNAHGLGPLKKETLFRREHATKHTEDVDDIVEEEMGALLMTLKQQNGDMVYKENIMMGKNPAHVKNVTTSDKVVDDLQKFFSDKFKQEVRESTGRKFTVSTSQIQEEKSGKIDIAAGKYSVTGSLSLNNAFLSEVIKYLNDATFTVKNYKDPQEGSAWVSGLKLGETNLLKTIIAELNIAFPENSWKYQRDIFYRGAQILVKTNKAPTANPETVGLHFTHMRFIYELSGLGLLDTQGNPLFAKYLIYNVPNSNEIYVKDTASLILDQIHKNRHYTNVFGTLYLNRSTAKGS